MLSMKESKLLRMRLTPGQRMLIIGIVVSVASQFCITIWAEGFRLSTAAVLYPILLMLMMIGASAGSTGGGMKVARFLILIKSIGCELKQMLHPKEIILVKVDGKKVKDETKRSVYVYFISYVMLLVASILIVSLNNFDFETTFTSVLTTMNNIGPGLNLVGPVENFAKFTDLSKIVLSIDMLAGRLEIFPFLMLFSPTLWTKKF